MIRVTCADCGQPFDIGDDFAGITEFCPACGALNDIPDPETAEPDQAEPDQAEPQTEPATPPSAPEPPVAPRGIPATLWWTILVSAVGFFAVACLYLFSPGWEVRNLQALNDAANRGDIFLADEDYPDAIKQYRFVLDTVDHRTIESSYIQALVDRASGGIADAENRLHAPPAPAPTTKPVPATQPDLQIHLAIKSFQREIEAFPAFVRAHPVVFPDDKGNWRRRQYVIWNIAYDPPPETSPLRLTLHYDCASHITEAHFSRRDALADDTFLHDESPSVVHCQSEFQWQPTQWFITRRTVTPDSDDTALVDVRKSLDDFYPLEAQAFDLIPIPH